MLLTIVSEDEASQEVPPMTETQNVAQAVQDQVLDGVRKSQQAIVEAVQAWADTVKRLTPEVPSAAKVTEQMPEPAELIDNAFDFASQLLAAQRQFAHDVLAAATPAPEPAKRSTAK